MKGRIAIMVVLLLLANAGVRTVSFGAPVPLRQSLEQVPQTIGEWRGHDAGTLTAKEEKILGADDYVARVYERDGVQVGLFIAFYQEQKSGDALHSPKNCLPGSGWETVYSSKVHLSRGGESASSFEANHFVVEKDGIRQDVLYWYQANERIFASEYEGKIYLVLDALQKGRTDGALVRITVNRVRGSDREIKAAMDFAREWMAISSRFLPT
jgi:EpsI family protein